MVWIRTRSTRSASSSSGWAILFSTHILEEVEASCTRAVIVDRGRIVEDGTPAELIAKGKGSLTDLFRKVTTLDTAA